MTNFLMVVAVLCVACSAPVDYEPGGSVYGSGEGGKGEAGGNQGTAGAPLAQGGYAGTAQGLSGTGGTHQGESGQGGMLGGVCVPGAAKACTCKGDISGVQDCVKTGLGWGECDCSAPSSGGQGGSFNEAEGGSGGMAQAQGGTGGTGPLPDGTSEAGCLTIFSDKDAYLTCMAKLTCSQLGSAGYKLCPVPSGLECRGGFDDDPRNCGSCDNVCPSEASYCYQGGCVSIPQISCIESGDTWVNGECILTYTDPKNCGTVGNDCSKQTVVSDFEGMPVYSPCSVCTVGICHLAAGAEGDCEVHPGH